MKSLIHLKERTRSFFVATLLLFFTITAYAHVREIRVNQNADGTLTWYLQTYHSVNQCGHSGAGLRINGISYPINSEHAGSIVGLSPTVFATTGFNQSRQSYAIVQTPYIAGNLNVTPYSNNVCWDFLVGGSGSFTPPPPPVCTVPPVTSASNTLGTPNNNNTECDATDDTIPVTLNINHLACGNITGDGQLSIYYSDGTLIGNVAYQNGISTQYTFNLPQGRLAELQLIDNDFPNNAFNYSITGLNGTSYAGETDTIAPTVLASGTTVTLDDNGNATITIDTIDTGSSDACGIASRTISASSFNCSNIGSNPVTLTVIDVNGNVASSTVNVIVQDNIAPVIEGQNTNLDMNFDAGNGAPASYTEDGITFLSLYGSSSHVHLGDNDGDGSNDILNHANCCSTPYRLTVGSGTEFTLKSMNVKSVSGNPTFSVYPSGASVTISSTGIFTFPAGFENVTEVRWSQTSGTMIIDDMVVSTKTSGQCPTDIITNTDPGTCGTNVSFSATATDNCSASVSFSPASGSFFNVGTTTVTATATDASGNTSSCSFNVTVNDNEAPNVITRDIPVTLDASGNATITADMINNGSTDSCGIASSSLDNDSFSCANVGVNQVILTVIDVNGNSASATANVTVSDVTAPNVITQDIPVSLDATGNATITADMINFNSSDACGIASLSLDNTFFSCANVGQNTVILTVTDNNGNSASLSAIVTVSDITPPIVVTQDIPVSLDAAGNATITADMINFNSSDACGIASLSLDNTTFSCANVGQNTVILTATDNNGNSASLSAIVTVSDVTAPVVVTNDIFVDLDASGNVTITPNMINNGSSDTCGIESYTLDVDSFDCSNTGSNTVILTVKDINGNEASLSANVTVSDVTAPTVITQSYAIDLANGVADITASDIDGGTFDNCDFTLSIDQDHFTCDDIGDHTVTLTATDASGNTASSTATVSILGNVPTIAINDFNAVQTQKINTIFLGFGPQSINLSTLVTGGSGFTYEWTTSSGEMVSNEANPSISPEVSTTYNVTVTNSNGCSASTSLYVCVIDARSFDKKGRDTGKITVCHHTNGKKGTKHVEINISENAVMTHLTNHGVGTDHADTLGSCDAVCVGSSSAKSATKTKETITSIADNLSVYPNPSSGIFDVKLTAVNLQTELYLFDTTGKLIQHKSISKENSSENIINMGNYNLASGFYLLKIITKDESITKKLIIEKSN
jgi:hypothetical protein